MTTEEKFDIIINKLTSLDSKVSNLEKGQKFLEKGQKSLEKGQNSLREDLLEFKNETGQNFDNTNKLINQAFEKISENISYQDKVTEIEKIIHSRQKSFA